MKYSLPICFLFSTTTVASAAQISICVRSLRNGAYTSEAGASVMCYDEDSDADDTMTGTYTTGSNGCVSLTYTKKTPAWYNPCTAWDCPGYTNPDIYCVVTKSGYYPLFTDTKEDWNQDNTANFGTVTMYPDRNSPGDTNGCGPASDWDDINSVVDFLTGFKNMCDNHDHCYNDCNESKVYCDNEFKAMMYSKCNDDWDFSDKSPCKAVADAMYTLVAQFGSAAYNSAQQTWGCT